MPAGDFTASLARKVLDNIAIRFAQGTQISTEFNHPVNGLRKGLESQTIRWEEGKKSGNVCQEVEIYFLQAGADLVVEDNTSVGANACGLLAGTQLQTNKKAYQNNVEIIAVLEVLDRCDNLLDQAMEVENGFMKAMSDIRAALSKRYVNLLTNNVQVNQFDATESLAMGFDDQGAGNRLKVAPANWDFELLQKIKLLADLNSIHDYFILDSFNLFNDRSLAEIRSLNDNQRDQLASFDQFNIEWDTVNIFQELSRKSTFVVNPHVTAFWNVSWSNSNVPVLTDPKENLYTFYIDDPVLRWNDNGVMKPIRYEVEYEYACNDRATNVGNRQYTHKWQITLVGGIDIAPAGFNRKATPATELTGIMEIVNEA